MILNSLTFLVIFTFVFILFWKIPKRFQWILLLFASYYFYGSYKPAYFFLIILTTFVNYVCALKIHRHKKQKKFFLLTALLLNLGVLFIFKYFNFFNQTINGILGINLPQFKLLLPLGISFYTLQVTGYLFDVYRNKIKPEKHYGFLSLFVCFFPQLGAGPIERYTTLMKQLKKQHQFDYRQTVDGIQLFTLGLFKKMVIADNLGLVVDRVFSSVLEYKGISLVFVILFYTWQIYMDFSGYTDMARGIAKMIGINLMKNFNLPYLATSVQDFWRRWHISFSSWLKDFIYIPLGGNRKGLARTVLNTMTVFVLSGLWHGANWTFVVWGILHGISISLERVSKKIIPLPRPIPEVLKIFYAYFMISVFWVFFRAETIKDALYILRNAFVGAKNFISPSYIWASVNHLFVFNKAEIVMTFSLLFTAMLFEIIQTKISLIKLIKKQPLVVRYAIYILLIFIILQLRNAYIQEFIYIRF